MRDIIIKSKKYVLSYVICDVICDFLYLEIGFKNGPQVKVTSGRLNARIRDFRLLDQIEHLPGHFGVVTYVRQVHSKLR